MLSNIQEGSLPITEYMDLTDKLSLLYQSMNPKDPIVCDFDGLDLDYDVIVGTVQTKANLLLESYIACFLIVKNDWSFIISHARIPQLSLSLKVVGLP